MMRLKKLNVHMCSFTAGVMVLSLLVGHTQTVSADTVRNIIFPVLGGGKFSNDFDAPRSNGPHRATDIMAAKHTPVVSPVDGVVDYVVSPQASWGYSVGIRDADGYVYKLIHMNNDTPGTDNGSGGEMNAYGSDMKRGNTVAKGQFLGWLGDSGNAETTVSHIHFEIYDSNNNAVNPYSSLISAPRLNTPVANLNAQPGEALPFGPYVRSRVQVSTGNLDGDGEEELVISPGIGSTPNIRVLNRQGAFDNKEFMAYDQSFIGGVTLATADIDGDGVDEVVTGTGPGNTSNVRVFTSSGVLLSEFLAYGQYPTGVNVSAGDLDGDGRDEIVTGTNIQSSTHVKVFKSNGIEVSNFFAYPGYTPGVNVSVGDVDADGLNEIITAPCQGGSAHLKIFSSTGSLKGSFFAYDNFYGGVNVDVGNVRSAQAGDEIITSPGENGGADIRLYRGNGQIVTSKGLYESWWIGGYDVAAGSGYSWVGTGGDRRSSIRSGPN